MSIQGPNPERAKIECKDLEAKYNEALKKMLDARAADLKGSTSETRAALAEAEKAEREAKESWNNCLGVFGVGPV